MNLNKLAAAAAVSLSLAAAVPAVALAKHGADDRVAHVRAAPGADDGTRGLEVRGRPTIGFGASHFTASDLTAARHTNELTPRAEVILSLDHAQRGLGTASCGPDTGMQYRLLEPRYSFGYSLRPIASRQEYAGS